MCRSARSRLARMKRGSPRRAPVYNGRTVGCYSRRSFFAMSAATNSLQAFSWASPSALLPPLLGVRADAEAALAEVEAAALVRLAEALGGDQDLAGGGVDHARGESDLALRLRRAEADALARARRRPRFSVENFVIEPAMMYLTPSTLPTLASLAALGSARSLCAKSCSARTVSSFLRSITRKRAVVHQRVDDLVGHALADVVLAPPVVDGAVVEVHHRDHGPLRLRLGRARQPPRAPPPPRGPRSPSLSFVLRSSARRV